MLQRPPSRPLGVHASASFKPCTAFKFPLETPNMSFQKTPNMPLQKSMVQPKNIQEAAKSPKANRFAQHPKPRSPSGLSFQCGARNFSVDLSRERPPDPRSEIRGVWPPCFCLFYCLFRALENVTYLSVVIESLLTQQGEMKHSLSTRLLAAIYFFSSLFRPMENLTYVPVVRDSL